MLNLRNRSEGGCGNPEKNVRVEVDSRLKTDQTLFERKSSKSLGLSSQPG